MGKTNVFQLLPGWETDNPVFGRTNNPWDLARTPGGSSGGEAAAVAYGGSQLGLGGDFGGSVRIPAAFCGVCGLKPTAHRLTRLDTPSEPFSAQEAIIPQPGPIAATVEDVALAMEILTAYRPDGSDGFVPPVPWPGPADGVDGLVVGWFDDNSLFTPSPAIRLAIGEATGMLASHGARVVPVQPPDAERTTRLFLQLVGADRFRASRNAARGETLVPALKRNFMAASMPAALKRPLSFGLVRAGRTPALAGCRHPDSRHARRVLPAAGPVAPAARRHDGRLGHSRDRRDHLSGVRAASPLHGTTSDLLEAASYALIANLLGLPAGTVPISRVQAGQESDRPDSRDPADRLAKRVEQDSAGLPVAVQVIGRPWREDLALAAMAAIERGARDAGTAPALPADPRPQATSDANR